MQQEWIDAITHKYAAIQAEQPTIKPILDNHITWKALRRNGQLTRSLQFRFLQYADVYCWTDEPTQACYLAARTIPPSADIGPEMLPTTDQIPQSGFWYFPHDWPGTRAAWPTHETPSPWAVSWASFADDDFSRTRADSSIIILLTVWTRTKDTQHLSPAHVLIFQAGWTLQKMIAENVMTIENDATATPTPERATAREYMAQLNALTREICPFFLASCAWLQQRIVVWESGAIERHARKRIARENRLEQLPPDVKVILLRRKETHTQESEHHDVDWSCRWLVSGHWRQQPYKDGRKLIYILPFMKGPDDKPLRMAKDTIYLVNR